MKLTEREEARRLRLEEGLAMRVIASRLGVALSSVSAWTRDIALTEEQHARLRQANPIYNQQLRGQGARSASARAVRLAAQEHGRADARRGDPLHQLGCMLYWAEGSKSRNSVAFCNSDPEMLRVFLAFLRGPCAVGDERIAVAINCHLNNGLTLGDIQSWVAEDARAALDISPRRHRQPGVPCVAVAAEHACLRDGAARRALHLPRAEHLRRDPGVRRLRPAGMAG